MASYVTELSDFVTAPERGKVMCLTLDTTARAYDLRAIKLGRQNAPATNTLNVDKVYLTIQAITASIHYYFADDDSVTLDRTDAIAAGGTLAETSTHGDVIPAGSTVHVVLERDRMKYLHIQGSAAGTAVIRASSQPFPGDH